jgi:ABC-type antimicrobial peptide transport system permease subunit
VDDLFGIALTSILVGLLALLGGAFAMLGWVAWRNPLLVRMGLRNVVRRRAQTTLIVVGLMLSTLIISAAFATGDTVGYSITNEIYRSFEEVDFIIGTDDGGLVGPSGPGAIADDVLPDSFLADLRAQFANDADIDGITGIVLKTLPVLNEAARLSEPRAQFVGIDPESVASFGGLRTPGGTAVPATALTGNRAYITEQLAAALDAGAGDHVTVFFENQPHEIEVIGVVRDTSVTSAAASPEERFGGLALNIESARRIIGQPEGVTFIAVSSRGGIRDTLELSDSVEDRLDDFIAAHPQARADVVLTKKQIVGFGELIGSVFVTIFLVFGLFSIAAGVMLIFLIFIMLAAERRSEMGMARAVGMNRLHLTESFLAEGMAYNVGSAAVGALLGLGVAWVLIFVLGRIFSEVGLAIAFHFNWQGFLVAYSLGVVLTFVTVIFSSWRAANLNIVRAIRDLPEPQPLQGADRSIGGLAKAGAGALWMIVWVALATIWSVAGFQLFLVGLATYGAGLIALALLVGWFVFGARRAASLRHSRPGIRHASTLLFWILLPIIPLVLAAWRAARRDPAEARRVLSTLLYAYWWVAFTVAALMAPVTWALLRSRSWAASHRNAGGWAVLMLLGGLLLVYLSGWTSSDAIPTGGWFQGKMFAYTGGTTLAVLAAAMLAIYFGAASRLAFTIAGLALVWYWLLPLPFSLFTDVNAGRGLDPIDGVFRTVGLPRPLELEGNIEMFFVSGISITAAATLVVIFNASVLLGLLGVFGRVLGGIAPAVRTAIAYPLAAKTRTALTLAMFTLVVFSLVVMATLNFNFTQLFLGAEASAGFDVVATGNASNRVPDLRAALKAEGYDVDATIGGVGTMVSAFPQMRADGAGEFHRYVVQGVDDEFLRLAEIPLQFRAAGYESDAAVFEALRTDPTAALIDASRFRQEGPFGGPPGGRFELPVSADDLAAGPWQPIPVTLRAGGGATLEVQVIGVLEPQVTGVLTQLFAVYTARSTVEEFFGGGDLEVFLVQTPGAGSKEASVALARDIESTLLERGIQAESITEAIDDITRQSTGFQLLFESFMGLGLVVGIAALGVIAFRTVVERRQQVGVLRAIGYTRRLIGLSFFMESSFIALTGIVMGLLLGTALSFNLLTSPDFTEGAEIDFQVPWVRIAVISGIAYGASSLMTLVPARSASRVVPAEALRYE